MKTPRMFRGARLLVACASLSFATPALADEEPAAPPAEATQDEAPAAKEDGGEAKGEAEEAAPMKYRTVTTKGFTVDLPDEWFERTVHRRTGKRQRYGRWLYTSPNRGYVFQVNIEPNNGKFAPQAKALQKRALAKLSNARIEKQEEFTVESSKSASGRQVRYAIVRGDRKDRSGETQRYHVLVMVSRSYGEDNRMLSIRLMAADRKVSDFLEVMDRVVSSFKPVE